MRLTDQNGQPVVLARKLDSGGEGDIYSVAGHADLVAKIYFRHSFERRAKLQVMISAPPADPTVTQGHVSICWPSVLLFNQAKEGVGFLMPRVDTSTSVAVLRLSNPLDRHEVASGFTWGYLLRTAANIASVVEAIHACGYVVGDLNESNFLVSDRALITLVDCDSMQIPDGKGQFFRCPVGKPDFAAPELQGRHFAQVDRNPTHDNFALGVMIFQLLMEGVHPFAGIWLGPGEPSLEQRIRNGDCPYSGSPNVSPMPLAPPFDFLPSILKSLVVRCFRDGQNNPASRPSPREWRESLTAVEKNLITCSINRRHVYPIHLSRCPWCERAVLLLGFDSFASIPSQKPMAVTPFATPRWQPALPVLAPAPPIANPRPLYYPTLTLPTPSRSWKKAAVVVSLILMTILVWTLANRDRLLTGAAPEQIADRGVCPFEGCQYGERWLARHDVDVYFAPADMVGVAVSSLQKKAVIRAGSWVRTETGLVLARRREGYVKGNTSFGTSVTNGPPLKDGQAISIYEDLGEGCVRGWIDGRFVVICDVASLGQAQKEWWIQIKTADGSTAWTKSPDSFVSEGGLNTELANKIRDSELPLPEKITQIDALLRKGAKLSGSGGKYGTDPIDAVISTQDVGLLRMLMSKGLSIRNSPCPAEWDSQVALQQGGDLMLEFLLENGMQLSCLKEPPLHAFLRFGIATDSYPVDRAIRVAEILVRNGARIDQRDSQGKSIFDVLDKAKSASSVAALREALNKMAMNVPVGASTEPSAETLDDKALRPPATNASQVLAIPAKPAVTAPEPAAGTVPRDGTDSLRSVSAGFAQLQSIVLSRRFRPLGKAWVVDADSEGHKLLIQPAICMNSPDDHCQKLFVALDDRFLGTDTYFPSWAVHDVLQEGVGSFSAVYEDLSDPDRRPPPIKVIYTWDGQKLRASATPSTRPTAP